MGKKYIRRLLLIFYLIGILLITAGCQSESRNRDTAETTSCLYDLPIDQGENKIALQETMEIMDHYKDLALSLEINNGDNSEDNSEELSEIQDRIAKQNYAVIMPDHYSEMSHYEKFDGFLKQCESGRSGSMILYRIRHDGGINRCKYIYDGNSMYLMMHIAGWEEEQPQIYYTNYSKVRSWSYSENGWFGYELYVPEPPEVSEVVDGCEMIRVKPFEEELKKWSKEVLFPIGYHGINILSCDWDCDNMENINFDACFECFYSLKGNTPDVDDFSEGIPEDIYENTLLTYLAVDKDILRRFAEYDKDKKIYHYSRLGYLNSSPTSFETSIPEVVKAEDLGNGTCKLTVNAVCDVLVYDDAVITHEITLRMMEDGNYKFLSNRVISNHEDRNGQSPKG